MPDKPTYEIDILPNGLPSLTVTSGGRKLRIHSAVNPMREQLSIEALQSPPKYGTCLIVLGTGLGYHLLNIEKHMDRLSMVICVDALPGIENRLSENPHASFLLNSPSVLFLTGLAPEAVEAELSSLIDIEALKFITVIEHPASFRAMPEYYNAYKASAVSAINRKASDAATISRFSTAYVRNALTFINALHGLRHVSQLKDAYRGLPGVVAGSGPGLYAALDAIASRRKSVCLIAVDSAASVLQSRGLTPDIIVTIDPQSCVTEHFSGVSTRQSLLVCSLTSFGGILTLADTVPFVSLNTHPLSQLLDDMYPGIIGTIDSKSGSVAGDAISLAYYAGIRRLALAGLDFSFPRYETYSRGGSYQRRYTSIFQNRLNPAETSNARYIFKSSGRYRIDGAFTRKSFESYRDRTDSLLSQLDGLKAVHLSEQGLPLRNAPRVLPNEFIAELNPDCGADAVTRGFFKKPEDPGFTIAADAVRSALSGRGAAENVAEASTPLSPRRKKAEELIKRFLEEAER